MHIWIAVTLAGLCGFLLSEWKVNRSGVWVFKTSASLAFVAAALAAGALSTLYGQIILAGLVLCVGGDILLIPASKPIFKAGIFSFLLGHVAYVGAFFVCGIAPLWAAIAALPVALAAFLVGKWIVPKVGPELRGAVIAYIGVISMMVCCSIGTWPLNENAWIPIAATAFFISDISVAIDRFVSPTFTNRLWGLPLYYGAQICFVLSL